MWLNLEVDINILIIRAFHSKKYPYKEIYQNDAMNLGRFKFTRDEIFQNAFVVGIECTSNLKVSLYGHKIVMLLHLKVVCSQTSHYICFKWNYKLYTKFQASPWTSIRLSFLSLLTTIIWIQILFQWVNGFSRKTLSWLRWILFGVIIYNT